MERPTRFEHYRFVGDKRSQVVHDLDNCTADVIDELMTGRVGQGPELRDMPAYICFGPDTLVEARNRGYKPHAACHTADAE